MVDLKMERPKLSAAQFKPLLPVVMAVGGVLALWLGWSAWELHRDSVRRERVQAARDGAVEAIAQALASEHKRFADRLESDTVRSALAAGDRPAAGAELTVDWPRASKGVVLPPDLDTAYTGLSKAKPGDYGRLGALEAALATDKPVARVIREGSANVVVFAAPVRHDGTLIGVASAQLPLERIGAGVGMAPLSDDSYLALRQGGASVIERGDVSLAGSAEKLSAPIPGTDLRVAAGVPDADAGPFGLGRLGAAVAALLSLLVALAALVGWRRANLLAGRAGREAAADDADAPTLAEAVNQLPPTPVPAVVVAPAAAAVEHAEGGSERRAAPAAADGGLAVDRSIFRAYDIRGIVGQTLDAGVAELIGHAIGTVMQAQGLRDIVVGRDGRLSGPVLTDGLIAGLRRAGRNVIDIGLAPTPLTYFGAYQLRAGSCVSVTGSHNPPDYNGFKIVVGGETLSGDAITDLYARIAENRLFTADSLGTLAQRDINDDYVQRVASDVQLDRPLKVVVDAGNGVAGELGPRVLSAIGADVTPLYCEIDGTFPNHHPDPSEPHNLADLIKMVDRLDADLGIAFDGDGDRLGVVTRDGQNIFPDRLLMLFAADVLERNPGAMILYDVKCTGRLPGHILRHGGSPLMWKTGHSLIKAKMRETDAELAGEMSGHFFFKERWYGFDDGIYAAARLLEILAAQPRTPTETLNALPDGVSTAEIKVDAPGGDPHSFVERFRNAAVFERGRLSTIDGLRVDFDDGWGLVRASNTTPVLVLRFDADSRAALERIQTAFREQLLALKPDLKLPF